ncbi:peptide ABC transporter substrate-binding protein [Rhodovastum atsumiense]|nr:peptide ABC transporter substrate-binding protein [Rhodovastum atsumiense]
MRTGWRRRAATAIFAVALAAVAAPASAQPRETLTIGVSQFPSTLHPAIDPEVIKAYALGFALRPISANDKDWKNTCLQCTELPSLTNGMVRFEGKGMAVTVTLRPGLRWGDGTPVTAQDLALVWKVGNDPASGFAEMAYWQRIDRVEVVDTLTAVMHFREPWTQFDQLPTLLPTHLEGPVAEAATAPGEYGRKSLYVRAPTTPGLYNGPYLITQYDSATQIIVLEPNPYWGGPKPGFRRIVLRSIGNTAALQANLQSGDVDFAPGDAPSLTLDQVLQLRRQFPARWTYLFRPALGYEHIDLNLDNPILADARVRRALLLAVDRQVLAKKLSDGLQMAAVSFVHPLEPMYDASVPASPHDPARARALLAEAGWHPGADGICRNARGERLALDFRTTAGNRVRELAQLVLKDQWKAVGVEALIRNEPARTLFGETLRQRAFTGMAMYAWSTPIGYPPRQTLASDHVPTEANNYGGSNYMNFRNARMDAAIAVAETDLDPGHQKAAWAEMQRIYAEDLPVLPLFFRTEAYVLPTWLKGVEPTGHSAYSSLWAEQWRAE